MTTANELYLARLSGNLSYPNVFSQLVSTPVYLLYTNEQQYYQHVYVPEQQNNQHLTNPK
jgi:hypothetical protein